MMLVVALAVTLAAPSANARFTNREAQKSLRMAYDYWAALTPAVHAPGYHCQRGNPEVQWHDDLGDAMASAERGGCVDEVPIVNLERPTVRRLEDSHACAIITHEFGHLLGYFHNRVKGSIMFNSTDGTLVGNLTPPDATWRRAYRGTYCGKV